jgi:hypothetical protein
MLEVQPMTRPHIEPDTWLDEKADILEHPSSLNLGAAAMALESDGLLPDLAYPLVVDLLQRDAILQPTETGAASNREAKEGKYQDA